eukprot:15479042-Alexandrium_andersonii.AAC.1
MRSVIVDAGVRPIAVRIRLARLWYVPRLMRFAPRSLLILLDQQPLWGELLVDDCCWMQQH